jgi:hypothetical protein
MANQQDLDALAAEQAAEDIGLLLNDGDVIIEDDED